MDIFLSNTKIIFACVLVYLSFGMVGARFAKAVGMEENNPALNPFYGWAIATVIMLMLAPWLTGGGLIAFLIVLMFAGLLMFNKDRIINKSLPATFFAGAALLLPILYGLCTYQVHLWDDASHWLPNAHFLFQYGRFPSMEGPVSYSAWPAYPYAYTFLIANVGWIVGQFVETVGPLLNLLLLVLFAAFLARYINPHEKRAWPNIRLFLGVFLAITLFNPGLFTLLLFSAYAEYATAVLLGFLFFVGWQYCQEQKRDTAIAFAMLAIIFVMIKQANVFLLAMLVGSLWVTTAQHRIRTLKIMLLSVVPALIINAGWEFYKSQHLPGLAFTFKPLHDWQWYYIPGLFHGMFVVMTENISYFALLIVIIISAIVTAFRKQTPFTHLMMSFAVLSIGYFAFLTLAYIGSRFADWEITSAASFFRYMSQLQCAAMTIVILKFIDLIRSHEVEGRGIWKLLGNLFILLVPVMGMLMFMYPVLPQPNPSIQRTRDYAHAIFAKMPPQGKIGLIGSATDGSENAFIRFEWCQMASPQFQPELTGYTTRYTGEKTPEGLKHFAERFDAVMVAPHDDLAITLFNLSGDNDWVSFKRNGKAFDKLLP